MSAQKSGRSRNTARKHLRQDDVLKQEQPLHTWRTRKDPLERIWPEGLEMLREASELEAKALFDHLSQCHPGEVKPGLLRTFQRRERSWRLAEGPDKEVMVNVSNNSTIRVRKLVYAVPSRLIGTKLLARIYENRIVLFAGVQEVARLPLRTGDSGAVIDFRHLSGHLVRKPGASAGYRWREELFPAPAYRAAFDHLERRHPAKADRLYLEILKMKKCQACFSVCPYREISAAIPSSRKIFPCPPSQLAEFVTSSDCCRFGSASPSPSQNPRLPLPFPS
jgi:hypothetical protein